MNNLLIKVMTVGAMLATAVSTAAPMMTPWGEKVTSENCWRFYPRPQLVRDNWKCLNGDWDYAITSVTNTPGNPWLAANRAAVKASGKIRVPYPLESVLSGVGRLLEPDEFLWYRRTLDVKKTPGKRLLLHFDGVDYRAMVFIGHNEVTDVPHEGMHEPFTLDVTDYVKDGANELIVCCWDPTGTYKSHDLNSRGKQDFTTHGCFYTRVSGIWQSVWAEEVPERYIRDYNVRVDIDRGTVEFDFDKIGEGEVKVVHDMPKNFECWSPENPKLYNFTAKYGADEIKGYFAMRKIEKRKDAKGYLRYFLNNKPYFMIGTLDQGWWPDGLLTPPSSEAIAFEIKTLKDCGFNMLRKHIKVEPRRYYHICDTMGLIIMQDLPSFNGDANSPYDPHTVYGYGFQRYELKAMIDNLRKAPCILEWIPYNEGWSQPGEFLTHSTLDFVRRYDPTRLVGGPSGWCDFEGGSARFKNGDADGHWATNQHRPMGECEAADTIDMHYYRGPSMPPVNDRRISFLGEFGGLGQPVAGHLWTEFDQAALYRSQNPEAKSWGYGGVDDTKTREGLLKTYLELQDKVAALAAKGLGGSIYTQTTDVEIEINGLLTYDRKVLKYDAAKLKAAHEKIINVVSEK